MLGVGATLTHPPRVPLTTQVDSCKAPITHLREYYQRYRVCEAHSKVGREGSRVACSRGHASCANPVPGVRHPLTCGVSAIF